MPQRTLGVALWDYRDHDGRRRRAYYGQTINLTADEITRGERAHVFTTPADTDTSEPIVPAPATPPTDTADVAPLPAIVATKPAWVNAAVAHGIDRTAAQAMTKQQLIDALTDPAENIEGTPSHTP